MSSDTLLFNATWTEPDQDGPAEHRLVARLAPDPGRGLEAEAEFRLPPRGARASWRVQVTRLLV
jgi:hypothetical protein